MTLFLENQDELIDYEFRFSTISCPIRREHEKICQKRDFSFSFFLKRDSLACLNKKSPPTTPTQ